VLVTDPETETEKKQKEERNDPILENQNRKYARLWAIHADTGAARQLTFGERHVLEYGWSRDGRTLAVATSTRTDVEAEFQEIEISLVAVLGGRLRLLATVRGLPSNLIFVDRGTATSFEVVSAARDYLVGIIVPGIRTVMEALETNTARLPTVEIVPPTALVGRSTVECIQSGLYFGNRAMIAALTRDIRDQAFAGQPVFVVGTGGFSRLFEREPLFDAVLPDLILVGLERALALNPGGSSPFQQAPLESLR
jgi:hypothetical protein